MMPTLKLVEVPVEVEEEEVIVYGNVQDKEVQPRKPVRIKVKIGSEYVAYDQNLIADVIVGHIIVDEVFEQPPKRRRSSPRVTKQTIHNTKTKSIKTMTNTNPPTTTNPRTTMDLPLDLPLPTDGILKTWKEFGDKGVYQISKPHWDLLYAWVAKLRSKPDYIADRVYFFGLIAPMKTAWKLVTPRDQWADVLPRSNSSNFFWGR
jgi:hypothetical protein